MTSDVFWVFLTYLNQILYRGVNSFLKPGEHVVMRRATADQQCLLFLA